MSNERFLAIIAAVFVLLFILMLADQSTCQNSDGSSCRFGGGRSVRGLLESGR